MPQRRDRVARIKPKRRNIASVLRKLPPFPDMKIVQRVRVKHPRWFEKKFIINAGVSTLVVLALVVAALLPLATARASTTLTWSTNGDFAQNKISKCSPTVSAKVVISGSAYTDPTCAASDSDANITLAKDYYHIGDIASYSSGTYHSVVVKNDGTVWAWGDNSDGELGDNTTTSEILPVQVKGPGGTGFLTNVKFVAAGWYSTIAVKNDGTVWAWGDNESGEIGNGTQTNSSTPVQVEGPGGTGFLTDVKSVSTGSDRHVEAVKNDGTVWGWGYNGYQQVAASGTYQLTPVEAIVNGSGAPLTGITTTSSGAGHTLALKSDGTVWAWGYANYGQIGNNNYVNNQYGAVQVEGPGGTGFLTNVTSISASDNRSFAVESDGTAYGWGSGNNGTLDNGDQSTYYAPKQMINASGTGVLTNVAQIAAGQDYTEILNNDGSVYAIGTNGWAQLGDGTYNASTTLIRVKDPSGTGYITGLKSLSVGYRDALAVDKDGYLVGWGDVGDNQLGLRASGLTTGLPSYIVGKILTTPMTGVSQIASGQYSSAYLKTDGTVWALGGNDAGELGDGGAESYSDTPVQVQNTDGSSFLTDVKQVVSGNYYKVALKTDGTVWAWGYNSYGQIGNGAYTAPTTRPSQVKDSAGTGFLTGVDYIAAGPNTAYAVKSDGTLWAWGDGGNGNTGVGNNSATNLPVQVKDPAGTGFLTGVVNVAGGYYSTVAVKSDGTVWSWGYNGNGELGNNSTTSTNLPVQVEDPSGSSFLTGVASVTNDDDSTAALKADGTVWTWGYNGAGQLGNGTNTQSLLPVQVKDTTGSSVLTGVASVVGSSNHYIAVKTDGTAVGWGYGNNGQLGNNTTNIDNLPVAVVGLNGSGTLSGISSVSEAPYTTFAVMSDGSVDVWGYPSSHLMGYDSLGNESQEISYPRTMYADVEAKAGYSTSGTDSGFTVDAGANHKYQWNQIAWNSAPLPANTKITFNARTSNDGTTWSAWTADQSESTAGSTTGTADMSGLPLTRYAQIEATLSSPIQDQTPTLNDFSITYVNDTTAPTTNASAIQMKKTSSSSATINDDDWTNASTPYFSWTGGADNNGGVGLLGYCLYLGQDSTADVTSTKGLLGTSPIDTNGACQYAVSGTNLDTSVNALATALTTADTPYYLLVKPIDKAGNVYTGAAANFSFRFDNTPPTNPSFISAPSQFIATKSATLTWPTSGSDAASDADSGLAGLQYKIGTGGTWYGDNHNGAQDITDVLANDGSYQTDQTRDYPLLNEGNNIVYFRAIDNAGNVSTTNDTAVIKINTTSPAPPQNLTATPSTNTSNSFAFNWNAPSTFVGPANAVTYCYTVNTLPTDQTCTYTPAGQTSLPADAYATQPGSNIMYVVAKDEAGNVNYDTYASVTFTANTPAPGIPVGTEIADISTKATSVWKLALSWAAPSDVGAGISKYAVYRSTNGVTFSQTATTSGLSYVDSNLTQQPYYYKIRACDSANNCGAFSDVFSMTPTGRFTSPPELVTSPSVQVSTKTATFTYVTDRESDSRIQYGTASGIYFPGEVAVSASTKNHKVEISNLDAGTTYFYKAKWTDEDGNTGISTELSFTTLPAPSIKDVSVLKTTLSSATIQFTSTDASSVNIYYGKTDSFGGVVSINTSRSESTYSVELPGLDDGATYYYKFSTFDADGNEYDSHLANTFTTPARPRISNLRFQPVAGQPTSTQLVTWTTNVPADSTVTYGKTGEATRDIYDATMTTDHQSTISNLDDASQYTLLAQSRDASGNLATSDLQVFETALDTRPPVISDIQVESTVKGNGSEARGQIVLSWKTDEPATSQVAYSQGAHGTSYTSQTAEDNRLSYDHVVIVSDLAVSAIYHLQPISNDKAGNIARGSDTSAIVGRATDSVLNIIISTLNKIFGL